MQLRQRIVAADLRTSVAIVFANSLREVASVSGPINALEKSFISYLLPVQEERSPAAFEDLWPHRQLFLSVCICLAVLDGEYTIEKARKIGCFAQQLGLSAYELAELEKEIFAELQAQGQHLPKVAELPLPKEQPPRQPATEIASSFYPTDLEQLWESDSELITASSLNLPRVTNTQEKRMSESWDNDE